MAADRDVVGVTYTILNLWRRHDESTWRVRIKSAKRFNLETSDFRLRVAQTESLSDTRGEEKRNCVQSELGQARQSQTR